MRAASGKDIDSLNEVIDCYEKIYESFVESYRLLDFKIKDIHHAFMRQKIKADQAIKDIRVYTKKLDKLEAGTHQVLDAIQKRVNSFAGEVKQAAIDAQAKKAKIQLGKAIFNIPLGAFEGIGEVAEPVKAAVALVGNTINNTIDAVIAYYDNKEPVTALQSKAVTLMELTAKAKKQEAAKISQHKIACGTEIQKTERKIVEHDVAAFPNPSSGESSDDSDDDLSFYSANEYESDNDDEDLGGVPDDLSPAQLQYLHQNGLLPVGIPYDGKCFFGAIAYHLGKSADALNETVRKAITEETIPDIKLYLDQKAAGFKGGRKKFKKELLRVASKYLWTEKTYENVIDLTAPALDLTINIVLPTGVAGESAYNGSKRVTILYNTKQNHYHSAIPKG